MTSGISRYLCALAVSLVLVSPSVYASEGAEQNKVFIIANHNVPIDELDASDLRNIYLGQRSKWSNGGKVKFFVMKRGEFHSGFLKEYLGKSSSQFMTYWRKLVFTGKGRAPKSVSGDKEMLDAVKSTKGAIGYISSAPETNDVKILAILSSKENI